MLTQRAAKLYVVQFRFALGTGARSSFHNGLPETSSFNSKSSSLAAPTMVAICCLPSDLLPTRNCHVDRLKGKPILSHVPRIAKKNKTSLAMLKFPEEWTYWLIRVHP